MLGFISSTVTRPNRVGATKDVDYHRNWARYCLYHAFSSNYQHWRQNTVINKHFYKGNQWILDEDLETFLQDESGDVRNRIKAVKNIIRPIIESYRGNAVRMQINAKPVNTSEFASNRREIELEKLMLASEVAKQMPYFEEGMRNKFGLGEDDAETERRFNMKYTDKFAEPIRAILQYVAEINELDELKLEVCIDLGLSGLGVLKTDIRNGEFRVDIVRSDSFIWDSGARRNDLSDALYQGECNYMSPTEIYELYSNITIDQAKAIDNYARQSYASMGMGAIGQGQAAGSGKVPVYEVYWKDGKYVDFAWVKDQSGYEMFTEIGGQYTEKDIIIPKEEHKKEFVSPSTGKARRYKEEIRKCILIPNEIVSSGYNARGGVGDIILEYGLEDYPDDQLRGNTGVGFKYKCQTWAMVDGEILSPVDDAINPQRLINRFLSVAESHVNNARGNGMVYDKDAVDSQGGEEELNRNVNIGKPVGLKAKRLGIHNVIGNYEGGIGNGTLALFNLVNQLGAGVQGTVGVNDPMTGSGDQSSLVGTTHSMIQQGTLMQEPFYYALANLFLQVYQSAASKGRKYYARFERKISIISGDEGAKMIQLTKDLGLESFRMFINRTNIDEILKQQANGMVMQFLQVGLIDDIRAAQLFNKGTIDDVSQAVRDYAIEKRQAMDKQRQAQEQAVQDQRDNQQQALSAMTQQANAERLELRAKEERDKQHDIDKIAARGQSKVEVEKELERNGLK